MRPKPILLILSLSALLLSSCMKQVINPDGSLNVNLNNGDASSIALATADSYQPVTKGSTWNYNELFGTQTITYTLTMTGNRSLFNGKTYYDCNSASSLNGGTNAVEYFYSSAHQYNTRAGTTYQGVAVNIDMPYLIDTVSVGKSWTAKVNDAGMVNGMPGRFVGTMMERNISKTVAGKVYNNVMHTQIALQYQVLSDYENSTVYDYYIAKGIGVIEIDSNAFGVDVGSTVLTSYTIK